MMLAAKINVSRKQAASILATPPKTLHLPARVITADEAECSEIFGALPTDGGKSIPTLCTPLPREREKNRELCGW